MRTWRRLSRGLRTGSRWLGGPHLKSGCPIFATVSSSLRWAIVRSTIRLSSSEPGYPDRAGLIQKIVTVTRPWPILRPFDKVSGDWIAVHVLQLFDSLVVGEDV